MLAKFLGLLTFSSNWGVSASDAAPTANESPYAGGKEQVRNMPPEDTVSIVGFVLSLRKRSESLLTASVHVLETR